MTVVADSRILFSTVQRANARSICIALALCLATTAYAAAPKLEAVNSSNKQLQLGTSYDLGYSLSKSAGKAEALSLTHGDFNTDGFQDLVSGYATDAGGMITLHRGNEEAYAPSTAASFAGLKQGVFPQGFVSQSSVYSVPVAPDLMVAGDFNRDGDMDLIIAKRGDSAMYFLAGSRTGFGAAQKIALAGGVDALAAGQIDVPDGMADLAVAISGKSGASLLVYHELAGINGKANSYKLPAAAEALAVGNLDDSPMGDVAVLAAGKALILHGYDQGANAPNNNRLETLEFDFPIQAIALGDFIWDRASNTELALLKADGSVQFAARGTLKTTPFSVTEARALRRQQATAKSTAVKAWLPGQGDAWHVVESTEPQLSKGFAVSGAKLFSARLSGIASDDLVIVDALTQSLQVLSKSGAQRSISKIASTGAPVAAMAMQTSGFVLNSLVSLSKGQQAPSILPSVALSTFNVTKNTDTNDGVCNADCSLREAISAANASPGADSVVVPAGTYTLSIANGGGLNEDNNAQGDLDVNDAVTITGAGAATTFIQAGTTNTNGIDKVFAFNPYCASAVNAAMSNVTVRFGRNSQANGALDFSFTGGGIDVCNTGAGTFSMTNVTVNQNTVLNSYGGGLNLDSLQPANGADTLTGITVSNNKTTSVASVDKNAGGINLFGDSHNVTLTNSTISSNLSAGEGGGLFVRHTFGGAILVQGSTISNNIAASRGGGVSNFNQGTATFTINQDSVVSGNTSQGLVSLAAEGGGIYSNSSATTTINEVTITGNSATGAGVPEQRGGGGIATGGGTVNVTFCRIVENTALGLGGSGIHKDSNAGTTTATNNWWGCNAGAASAPCDRAVKDLSLGTLIVTPHLVLNHAASPSTIVVGQTSALTADFLTNSASAAIAVANLDAIIGTTHAHNNAVRGTLSATQTAIQAAGSATATFTATAAGAGSADSVVDSQTKTVAITINKATTTTTITSDTPDPSVGGGVVAVNYSVAVSAPGSGTPTGNVVVTISGGAETCTGTVAAGACNITLTTIGSRTLTATYAGDTNFTGSSDTEAHTVVSPTNVSIAVAPASVNEDGATNLIYTVTRDTNLVTATTVNITTSGSATSGTDYSGGVATATIPANGTTATITIDPSLDSTVESDETVILTVATGAGYTVGTPASATGTILNDDLPSASIAVAPASVAEDGVPNLVYTVTLDQPALTPTSINFTTAGTATSSTDYAAVTSPLVIPTGNTTGTITVNPTADTTIEADETVILMLAAGAGYTIGTPANATGTILNDDLPNLTINDVSLNEGSAGTSNATFTVSLSAPAGPGGVSFDIATANGTATAGSDYAAKSLSGQTISAGSSTYTFTVLVNGDTLNEPNETFFVNVSNVMGAIVVDGQALGTITNDDSVPALSIDNVSVLEGNAGTANAVFAVTLSAASGQTVSVNYATADGTAQQPGDYTAKNGTLTFTPGQTTATVTVLVNGDIVLEGDETFTVGLSGATNATISTATGTGTIIDDELPTLAINDVSITEGNVGTSVMTFTVTRTGTTASASGFSFATADGTALTSDSDYVTANGTGSIAGGGASGTTTVSVTINGDAIFENNESFVVNLTAPTNAVISDAQGVGTITNDDTAPTLSINDVSITEGNTGTQNLSFTVTRTGLTALPASFTATSANGTATAPSDYLAALAGVSSIAGGGATGTTTLTATVNGDFIAEANETFSVNLSAPINATISDAQGIGTINNDDTLGIVVTQSGGSTDVTEGGATDSYTLVLTSQPTSNVSISVTPDTQVTVATSPVVFTTTNWNVAQTVTVTAVDDVAVEGQHTGTISHAVTSADAAYNGFAVANVVANITDNDLPTLAINDVSIVEGNAGTSTLSFTVIRTGTTPSTVGFSYATSDGTALTSDNDYVAAIGTGMIPSGGATGTTTVSVTINGDAFFENNETFNVNLSAPTNAAISDGTGVGTITNDDTAPVITISDQTVTEGNTGTVPMVFTITRTGLSKLPATVVYASADDSATAPSDYTAVNGTAIIAADTQNVATTTVTVLVNGDTTIEGNETLFLNLSTPGNATIGDNQGLGTITNDDGPPSFTPAGAITRQQGSSATLATLGTVSDLTDPAGSLTVAIVADSTVGVSTTALTNTNGTVTANIAASCTATAGSLTVQVTDLGGLTGTDIVPINVSANTPPTLSYSNVIVGVGTTSSQNPSTGLSDNGSVSSIAVQSAGSYTGGISVSNAGVISLNNATPAGTHTITVRATDNCGASTDATVQVTVNQATTFKEVTSNVSPSRFGQALTLSAQLSGVDPTGSVEFFAGALSLGSAPLVNSPSGGTSLKLASLSISTLPVGNSNITVVYAGDVNNAASSSAILLQTVQAADTSIVLSPAVNPAVVGSSTINIQVQALAPGGGIPAGMVMLSAGPGNNCVATLTAGNGSCVLNFTAQGYAAITASYTPANGNHLASIGGTALVVVGNPSSTDLRVRIGNGVRNIGAGQTVRYDIVVDNIGTEAAVGRLQVPLSSDYSSATFSCLSAGPADCGNPSTGTGSIDREVSLAPGGVVIYSLDVTAPLNPERTITQSASITTKAPTTDTDLSNNEAFDIDPMGLLSDGFEDQAIAE